MTLMWIQLNFLRQTAALRYEVFPTFQELILSPYSGCAGGLVEPKLMTKCPHDYIRGVIDK